jgi:hypothetical protein
VDLNEPRLGLHDRKVKTEAPKCAAIISSGAAGANELNAALPELALQELQAASADVSMEAADEEPPPQSGAQDSASEPMVAAAGNTDPANAKAAREVSAGEADVAAAMEVAGGEMPAADAGETKIESS